MNIEVSVIDIFGQTTATSILSPSQLSLRIFSFVRVMPTTGQEAKGKSPGLEMETALFQSSVQEGATGRSPDWEMADATSWIRSRHQSSVRKEVTGRSPAR